MSSANTKEDIAEKDINSSLNAEGAVSYVVVENGEIIGGAIVKINAKTNHNHLDILFVRAGVQSKGVGTYIWNEIERLYPDTKIWETYTPYFEKRNIHFYVNKCGFKIVEFFNPKHPAEWEKSENETENMPEKIGQYFLRFEKVMTTNCNSRADCRKKKAFDSIRHTLPKNPDVL